MGLIIFLLYILLVIGLGPGFYEGREYQFYMDFILCAVVAAVFYFRHPNE